MPDIDSRDASTAAAAQWIIQRCINAFLPVTGLMRMPAPTASSRTAPSPIHSSG